MKSTRGEVYLVLDGEREYQEKRWPKPEHEHSPEEWITYMEDYLSEAKHILSREDSKTANDKAMVIMRKVTALGVAAMEQLGAIRR